LTCWRKLADEIAQDLPVLLLVTLDAPAPLGQLTKRQHTEPTRLAEELEKQGLARCFYLGQVTAQEVVDSLGPTHPELSRRLDYLAGGDP